MLGQRSNIRSYGGAAYSDPHSQALGGVDAPEEQNELAARLLAFYEFKSPLEKELDEATRKLHDKEAERDDAMARINSIKTLDEEAKAGDEIGGIRCRRCHMVGNHKKNKCPNPECKIFEQCRVVEFHDAEKRHRKQLRAKLDRAVKEAKQQQIEVNKIQSGLLHEQRSFDVIVRPHLIRTNPTRYLISLPENDKEIVPKSKIISTDLGILEHYYNRKVPKDLVAERVHFQQILKDAAKRHSNVMQLKDAPVENELRKRMQALASPSKSNYHPPVQQTPTQELLRMAQTIGGRRVADLQNETEAVQFVDADNMWQRQGYSPFANLRSPEKKRSRQNASCTVSNPTFANYNALPSAEINSSPTGRSGNVNNVRGQLFPQSDNLASQLPVSAGHSGTLTEGTYRDSMTIVEGGQEFIVHKDTIIRKELKQLTATGRSSTPIPVPVPSKQVNAHVDMHIPKPEDAPPPTHAVGPYTLIGGLHPSQLQALQYATQGFMPPNVTPSREPSGLLPQTPMAVNQALIQAILANSYLTQLQAQSNVSSMSLPGAGKLGFTDSQSVSGDVKSSKNLAIPIEDLTKSPKQEKMDIKEDIEPALQPNKELLKEEKNVTKKTIDATETPIEGKNEVKVHVAETCQTLTQEHVDPPKIADPAVHVHVTKETLLPPKDTATL